MLPGARCCRSAGGNDSAVPSHRAPRRPPPALALQPRPASAPGVAALGRTAAFASPSPLALALPAHPYGAASLAEAAAFNRSEVAQRIRASFEAMVARSPIGGALVRACGEARALMSSGIRLLLHLGGCARICFITRC